VDSSFSRADWRSPNLVLICAGLILTLAMGISHGFQIGSFVGAWLGGFLFDRLGSYDLVWYLSIALGVVAGLINWPIDEREIKRPAVAKHAA
jgi:MFS family permease